MRFDDFRQINIVHAVVPSEWSFPHSGWLFRAFMVRGTSKYYTTSSLSVWDPKPTRLKASHVNPCTIIPLK